jgi:hypothetical protein
LNRELGPGLKAAGAANAELQERDALKWPTNILASSGADDQRVRRECIAAGGEPDAWQLTI